MWKRCFTCLMPVGLLIAIVLVQQTSPVSSVAKEAEPKAFPVALAVAAPAPAPTLKTTPSRITGVTVYPNSALVRRDVDIPEGKGVIEVVVTPLPSATVYSSLYTEGNDNVRVLMTRFRTRTIQEDTRADVRKLNDEIKLLQLAREKLDSDMRALQADGQFIGKLENFTSANAIHATEKGAVNSEATIAMTKFIMETRSEKAKSVVGIQQQLHANQDKVDLAQRRLADLSQGFARTERDAVIVVEKINAAAGKVQLNYLVDSAAWLPQYKLRTGRTAKDAVQVEYLASIMQQTGEDWSNVNLTLSTAKPTLNAAPPDLQTLKVTVVPKAAAPGVRPPDLGELEEQVKNLRMKAQKDFNERKATTGIGLFNTAAALDQSWELLNPEEAVKRGCSPSLREGPSVTYHLATKMTVPSRTDEQVLEIARLELMPEYYYKSVPILTTHVYRLAELTNKSDRILLPGDATMYIGSDFVGQMTMPLVAIGETFTAGFGIDPQIQVQRQMIDKTRTSQGGNQSLRYEYRILVNSYKTEKIQLRVWDRLPHADNDSVAVTLSKTTPELSKDPIYLREQRPNNLLRWDVLVEPGMAGEKALSIHYEFKMELDRQMTLSSFQSAGIFGMAPQAGGRALPPLTPAEQARIRAAMARLSPEDRRFAEAQVFCAIDQETRLGASGPILKTMVKGTPVFLCCKGCEAEAKSHPDETLTKLQQLMRSMAAPK